jgi:hypothetical protein
MHYLDYGATMMQWRAEKVDAVRKSKPAGSEDGQRGADSASGRATIKATLAPQFRPRTATSARCNRE